eukprot:IDg1527t1
MLRSIARSRKRLRLPQNALTRTRPCPSTSRRSEYKTVKKRLIESFAKDDARERRMSGIGGAVGEMEELLGRMLEEQEGRTRARDAEKAARTERDEQKGRVGRALMEQATGRRKREEEDGEEEEDGARRGRGRAKRSRGMEEDDGLGALGDALKDSDLARIELEREKLAFERERLAEDKADREAERAIRREEREAWDRLELEKHKLLMEAFMGRK